MSPTLLLAALALPGTSAAEVLRHALIVGSNAPSDDLAPLLYAHDDARRMADLLVELGGFSPGLVTVLESPTDQQLAQAIALHHGVAAGHGEDLFLFYYSGHADQGGLRLSTGDVPFDRLRSQIRQIPAEVRLGVLDACRSGEITRLKGLALAEPFMDEAALSAEGEAWLTAASADEAAQESDRLRGSFFTHYLLSGLRGAADTGDGVVSLDEAYAYAYDRTVARTGATTGGTQHPAYDFRIQGKGDLPLTDVRRASARLRLPLEMAGVVTVLREPDDVPVAEVSKAEGVQSVLALSPGTYRLQLRAAGSTQEARFGLSEGADLAVPALAFRSLDRAVAAKGSDSDPAQVAVPAGASPLAVPAGAPPATNPPPPPEGWRQVQAPTSAPTSSEAADEFRPNRWLGHVAEKTGQAIMSAGASLQGAGRKGTEEPTGSPTDPAPTPPAPEAATTPAPDAATGPTGAAPAATLPPPLAPQDAGVGAPAKPRLDLRHSPVIAASASALLPGAGQAYNGQWAKGAGMLIGWGAATGGAFSVQRAMGDDLDGWGGMLFTGPTPGLMIAQMVRGWAAADGWQVLRREGGRPVTGVVLTYGTAWRTAAKGEATVTGDLALASTGLSVDWVMDPGFSLGVDRTGYVRRPDGSVLFDTGARMAFGFFERSRLRPSLFVYGGLEVDSDPQAPSPVAGLAGAGADLRWYLTPRYFVTVEGRGGVRDDDLAWSSGAGLGLHLGRPGQGRPERGE
ncbi:caspase family protein [Myxococcota bacterium]|nr:caspase family protein [Myxococcota bacterium]